VTVVVKIASGPPPAVGAAATDPEKQVLKLSRTVGPGESPVPTVTSGPAAPAQSTPDPFEQRKEVRTGKALQDSTRPIDAPAEKK
jgi:hypothetical protein